MREYVFKNKLLLGISIIFITISSLLSIFMAFLCQYIVNTATYKDKTMFTYTVIFGIAYLIFEILINVCKEYFNAKFVKSCITNLKNDVFNKILKKDIIEFKKNDTSKYITNLTGDIQMIESDYFNCLLSISNYVLLFVFAVVSLIKLNLYITLAIFIIGWIPVILSNLFINKLKFYKENYSLKLSQFTGKIKDIFSGFDVIKSFNIQKQIIDDYKNYNNSVEESKLRGKIFSGIVASISQCSGNFMFIVTLILGAYFCISGKMTIGELIAIVQLMNYIVNPLINMAQCVSKMESVKPLYENMCIQDSYIENRSYIDQIKFNSVIKIENLFFKYSDISVLDNISLHIEKGKKYAVVGESGGGKSTLIKLLLRYYDNYEGKILLDNIDFNMINPDKWFDFAGIIQQNVFLFDGTIKDNIVLYKDYPEEKIYEAIKNAGLETLVSKLTKGINTDVGENGSNLSGGEKQRISIARALIRENSILVLDEATSSLDNNTAFNIENTILNIKDITCLIVTHKLIKELLVKYDEIIVMKDGKIVEKGSLNQLIENEGYFYRLYYLNTDL